MLLFAACFVLFSPQRSFAQKYAFSHYDIEDGLVESQASKLCQDNEHRLWIATFGGVSRFDGKGYYSLSKANGLPDNFVICIHADRNGIVWFGTYSGLQYLENQKVYNFPMPLNFEKKVVTSIAEDGNGTIWVVIGRTLFRIEHRRMVMVKIPGQQEYGINAIAVDKTGRLFVAVYNKGLYYLSKKGWINDALFAAGSKPVFINKIVFDKFDRARTFLLSAKGILTTKKGIIMPYDDPALSQIKEIYLSLEQDAAGGLWIGTTTGAYSLNKHQLIHYTSHNGLTNNSVLDIFNDRDNNLWLATSGNGVFKYEQDNYVTIDQTQGTIRSPVVMAIARDKNQNIVIGTDGGDLMKLKDGKLSDFNSSKLPAPVMIGCLYADKRNNLWIGTEFNGVWKYDGSNIFQVRGTEQISPHQIREDSKGTIWIAGDRACYYIENDTVKPVPGINYFVSSLFFTGKDSLLVGLARGLRLIVHGKVVDDFKFKALDKSSILCMLNFHGLIVFGTDDKGLLIWNPKTGAIRNYNVKDGLKSYIIYSLLTDRNGVIWVGTGRGVNRVSLNPANMNCTILDDGNSRAAVVETNQNSILADGDKILIGTTKGLKIYNTSAPQLTATHPYTIIQSVKLLSQDKGQNKDITNKGGDGLVLSSNQNHLAISFLGVYLKNPESISYEYKLTGLDDKFCLPVKNNTVDYPSLPAGKYTFEVRAITDNALSSINTVRFNFEIIPPFYKTIPFQVAVILFFVLVGIGLQDFVHRRKIRNQLALETMKREEKIKIRQQTAEDFHDDLGNKLTRINVLAEILNTKIDADKTDQRNLVEQIRQNVASLYNGTKDILWALDPKSDNLFEMLMHIKEVGSEIFQDTPITFQFIEADENLKSVKLTMEYSRNITMIFKEILNNVLKHAKATKVTVDAKAVADNEILISLRDNGSGFDQEKIKKGYGINNINARAKRINSELNIFSKNGMGTLVELKFRKI